jgi:hypothetical protein
MERYCLEIVIVPVFLTLNNVWCKTVSSFLTFHQLYSLITDPNTFLRNTNLHHYKIIAGTRIVAIARDIPGNQGILETILQ